METSKQRALIIRENDQEPFIIEDFELAFQNLKITMENLKIKTASISIENSGINHKGWFKIKNIIRDIFAETDIIITICRDELVIPDPAIRQKIIQENHESPFAGHKGKTYNTYNKIRLRYFRINMKKDVENFIRACISCQKKRNLFVLKRNNLT